MSQAYQGTHNLRHKHGARRRERDPARAEIAHKTCKVQHVQPKLPPHHRLLLPACRCHCRAKRTSSCSSDGQEYAAHAQAGNHAAILGSGPSRKREDAYLAKEARLDRTIGSHQQNAAPS